MKVTDLALEGVKLLEPTYFEDYRGYYCETYSKRTAASIGIATEFVQDNHLLSLKRGTIRGIHFQNAPAAQAKLLRCTQGKILDVVIDLRVDSPSYMQSISIELDAKDRQQILIPRGFGHACIALEDNTEVQYKVDALYNPTLDRAIAWNDPQLGIDWRIAADEIVVSEKDKNAPTLENSDVNFTMENCQ